MAKTPEGDVKKTVKQWLTDQGVYYHMAVGFGYGRRTLDFLVCFHGRFAAFEAKRKGATAQAFQNKLVRDIKNAEGIAFVFDSFEDFLLKIEHALGLM